jgi:outer membrane immunogenic protein
LEIVFSPLPVILVWDSLLQGHSGNLGNMIEARTSLKGSATALAAVAAASGGASAADVSAFRTSPVAAPSWEGWYAGASLGASWLSSNQDPGGLLFSARGFTGSGAVGGAGTTAGAAGWMLGLQGGYNWQHSNFVYGLESDISWIGANTASSNSSSVAWGRYSAASASSSRVDALWTFRTRFGIDFNGTLPYLTAGFALGHIQNSLLLTSYAGSSFPPPAPNLSAISGTSWVPGVVVGGGIEHQLTRNWNLRGEIMWVGFESKQLGNPLGPGAALGYAGVNGAGGAAKFTNSLTFGKVGLNYRF